MYTLRDVPRLCGGIVAVLFESVRLLAAVPLRLMSPSVQIVGRQLGGGGVGKPIPLTADVFVAPLPNRSRGRS